MLIPKDVSRRKFKKGDKVILQDLDMDYYIITKGHELIYWGYDDWGDIVKIPDNGTIINKQRPNITHKVSINEAKKISIKC
jgi:signal peptidase I